MRSKRTRFVRLTSLGGALMLVTSALAVLGVAADSGVRGICQ